MHNPEQAIFTNMCMIYDHKGNVLVQNRVKNWCGVAFPGGHLENMESIVDSVKREILVMILETYAFYIKLVITQEI